MMNNVRRARGLSASVALLLLTGAAGTTLPRTPVWAAEQQRIAQDEPPDSIPDQDGVAADRNGADPAALLLRIGRLETQIRTLTGEIEQLQFQNKRLDDNMRKLQQDTDFRFQDLQGHAAPAVPSSRPAPALRRGDAEPGDAGAAPSSDLAGLSDASPATPRPARPVVGDVFDPDANPGAPGAPRPLGTTAASPPLASRTSAPRPGAITSESRAPLDLMQRPAGQDDPGGALASTDGTPSIIAAPASVPRPLPNPNAVASLAPGGTREEFDQDNALYKQGQFDGAATGLQSFVEKYPKDRLVPDAIYLMGESYSKLGRHREAAEQFLRMSTDYGKSPRAADALLRLGMSLNALGAREQACATYQEVSRKYPAASTDVRAGVDRELKRSHCRPDG